MCLNIAHFGTVQISRNHCGKMIQGGAQRNAYIHLVIFFSFLLLLLLLPHSFSLDLLALDIMIFNRIQTRCASVLASLPPSPHSSNHCIHQAQQHIITPASLPITATSNNAFNPNYIPKNTKERLTLGELYKVLDNSKSMYKMIQNEYLGEDDVLHLDEADQELSLEELLEEQCKLIQLLKKK